ncbi:MAG: hypothetical protein ABIX28_08410 [Vicinamibacterales bacterium]
MFTPDADPSNLAETGWGIVLPAGESSETVGVLQALEPLLARRREQAGDRFRVLEYRRGEDAHSFLARYGEQLGAPSLIDVPGYLLLIGAPSHIPFDVQVMLCLYYAVGRLAFDSVEEYASYAAATAQHEDAPERPRHRVVAFAPGAASNPPLDGADACVAESVSRVPRKGPAPQTELVVGPSATRHGLLEALAGGPSDLLFTVTHTLVYPPGHPRQRDRQGSLLCAPSGSDADTMDDRVLAAADLSDDVDLRGMISVHAGSFCAGTGQVDSLAVQAFKEQHLLAPEALVGPLPRRLLGRARPVLAVIGQIDRLALWGPVEQRWTKLTPLLQDLHIRLIRRNRVGHALSGAAVAWASLSAQLAEALSRISPSRPADEAGIAATWAHKETVRSVVLIGDPAVRLAPVAEVPAARRPT